MAVRQRQRLLTTVLVFLIAFTVIVGAISQSVPAAVERTLSVTASYIYINNGLANEAATIYAYKTDGSWTAIRHNNTADYYEISVDEGSTWNRILLNIVEDETPQLFGDLDAQDNALINVGHIDLDPNNGVSPMPYRIVWNPDEDTADLGMEGGTVNLQIGQEMLLRGKNATGAQIDNGMAVRVSGVSSNRPEFGLADADDPATYESIGLATEDIANNVNGYVTTAGLVRDLDTTGTPVGETWNEADRLFVSNTPGELTNILPTSTERTIFIGIVVRSHATEGIIWINPINIFFLDELSDVAIAGIADDDFFKFNSVNGLWENEDEVTAVNVRTLVNGSFKETFDALVTSAAGTVTMSLEQSGTGDLAMQFSDGDTILDCTDPVQTIVLTAGTDSSPQGNYVYIPQSTKVLTLSTSTFPAAAEHIKVGYFLVPSAAYAESDGVYINQNWNDHLSDTNDQGHLLHMAERSRRDGAYYFSGIDPNGTDQAAGSSYLDYIGATESYFKSAAGVIYQMHRHSVPAVDTSGSDTVLVVNWNGDSYHEISDLTDIVADSAGVSLANRYFNVFFFAVGNKTGEHAPMMAQLPSGSYLSQSSAESDVDRYDALAMPREFSLESSTGVPVCRMTLRWAAAFGALTHISTTDLRGGGVTGAGAGGGVPLTVEEQDSSPSVSNVNTIKFPNGSVTDDGGGIASVDVGGTPGGADTQVQYNDGGSFAGDAGLIYDAALDALYAAGYVYTLRYRLMDGDTNHIDFLSPALADDWTLTWPVDDGDSGQVLRTDGAGVTTWVTAAGGGDMLQATYDTDTNDIVDKAEAVPHVTSGDVTVAEGQIIQKSHEDALAVNGGSTGEVQDEVLVSFLDVWSFNLTTPKALFDTDTKWYLTTLGDKAPNGIVIVEMNCQCDADPTTEIDANLMYATGGDFIGLTGATVIIAIDSTAGVFSEDTNANFNGGNPIPAGAVLYVLFDAAPDVDTTQYGCTVTSYNPED